MDNATKEQTEKRNLLSSFFITVLIGLAYQEMITPVRDSIRHSGITLGTSLLMAVFFLTSIRFFIGNQLYLVDKSLIDMPGLVWFYDLMFIIIQSVLLIFLGGVSSVEANRDTKIGFLELLIALYIIDVVWIISQWLIGKILQSWRRKEIPSPWAYLNAGSVFFMLVLNSLVMDLYTIGGLLFLFVINLGAFVIDIILVDRYKTLWASS
jgi:hypothetical protein